MRAIRISAVFLLPLLVFAAQTRGEPVSGNGADGEPKWSEPVNGLEARIELKRAEVFNGTPIVATYLHLRNATDVMNPLTIPWDRKLMKFEVADAKGSKIMNRNFVYDGMMLEGTVNLVLPIRGELSFDYSSHGLGIPADKAAAIDLGSDANWIIDANQGECFLRAVLEVPGSGPIRGGEHWHGRIELPPVRIPVGIEPIDKATAEKRIKELGPKMLDRKSRVSDDARRALSLINDPGVIPWYIKALDSSSYELKFCAIDRLSRSDADDAFEALKKGMATSPKDFGEGHNPNVLPTLVQNIRGSAAQGLARSPHHKAKPLLLTYWNDSDPNIRLEVVHLLGKTHSPKSLDMLKKMSGDSSELVRGEAKRYLELAEKGENSPKPDK